MGGSFRPRHPPPLHLAEGESVTFMGEHYRVMDVRGELARVWNGDESQAQPRGFWISVVWLRRVADGRQLALTLYGEGERDEDEQSSGAELEDGSP